MKKALLFLIAFVFSALAFGQVTFQKKYGGSDWDVGYDIQKTFNEGSNGFILAGYTLSYSTITQSAVPADFYLVKINLNGDTLWSSAFGGSSVDIGYSVKETFDKGFIVAGETQSFGSGATHIYLVKTSSDGSVLWSRTFGGPLYDGAYSVIQVPDGGFILAGTTVNYGAGNSDTYLIKTDSDGDLLWTKTYGGSLNESATSVIQTADGGLMVVGTSSDYTGNNYGRNISLIKTDSNGNMQWAQAYGGTGYDLSTSIQQLADGGYVFAGFTQSFGPGSYLYLNRTDSGGNLLWSKCYGGSGSGTGDGAHSVQICQDGGFIISGFTDRFGLGSTDIYMLKTDSNGSLLWSSTYGGSGIEGDVSGNVQESSEGGYIVCVSARSAANSDADFYVVKTDASGHSGCNETFPNTQVFTPNTIVSASNFQTSSGGVQGIPATQARRGCTTMTLCSTAGINESQDPFFNVQVSPNPSTGILLIKAENDNRIFKKSHLSIYNASGDRVYDGNLISDNSQIDISAQPVGIYLLQMKTEQDIFSKKIIITR